MFKDRVDRLRIERPARGRSPPSDPPKHASHVHPGGRQPGIQCLDRPACEIDDFVVLSGRRFGPPKMNCQRGQGGLSGTSIGVSSVSCTMRRPAISLRQRQSDAKATIKIARSMMSRKLSLAHLASSICRISPVTAFALSRRRFRGTVRTAGRIACLRAGEEKGPDKPRHWVMVDQPASWRRRVSGAGRWISGNPGV